MIDIIASDRTIDDKLISLHKYDHCYLPLPRYYVVRRETNISIMYNTNILPNIYRILNIKVISY